METFGERVRNARISHGWTQKELAVASGLTQSAIGNYESGQRTEPSGPALLRLANALSVPAEWLQHGNAPARKPAKKPAPGKTSAPSQAWPFRSVDFEDYQELAPADKKMLEALVDTFIRSRLPG